MTFDRRRFVKTSSLAGAALALPGSQRADGLGIAMDDIPRGERPGQAAGVQVLPPRGRAPLSFIIDDSTCLVNMGHYCMPQFAAAHPERAAYKRPWRQWPREIPDAFVREFGEWCREHGVKGKYSVVPYPACVGWVDRFLPGWSKGELRDSLKLVREFMMPDWDIHPEMISHTRVLDLKTGRPIEELSRHTMENSHPQRPVSEDYLASYIAYALRVLKNVDLPCEGFTTPGGFGNLVKSELSRGGAAALRDVFRVEVPHYFKYLETAPGSSTAPRVEHASGLGTDDVRCTVNVVGGTGDWFGGWDGAGAGDVAESAARCIGEDGQSGRLPEMIAKGEPAIMICHWPGMYCNGDKTGFEIFQHAVRRVNEHHGDRTQWMKVSAIARYWAVKELTAIDLDGERGVVEFDAPFAAPAFTVRVDARPIAAPALSVQGGEFRELREVRSARDLAPMSYLDEGGAVTFCFDQPKGTSRLRGIGPRSGAAD